MTSKRPLLTLAGLLALLLAAAPALATDSGGAPVQTLVQESGGVVAPAPETDAAPTAEAAQEDTPTTPEGEEQPPDGEPPETETAPDEEGGPVTPPGGEGTGGESTGGFLPSTGFEVAALAAIGLGLMMAGGALWPTSSWPPPRDRLSRSTRRR